MSNRIEFFVPGLPVSAGSKRAFKTKTGRIILAPASNKQRPWMDSVRWAAINAFGQQVKIEGPIFLKAIFILPRPKGHFGTGKNRGVLKKNAPNFCATRPDLSKLVRAIEDAITGVIWRDDSQIIKIEARKIYDESSGVQITIQEVEPLMIKMDCPVLAHHDIFHPVFQERIEDYENEI